MDIGKAERATTKIAGIIIEVFKLSEQEAVDLLGGQYVISQSQVAEAVGKTRDSMLYFLRRKRLECPGDKTYECCTVSITKDWKGRGNNQSIKAVHIDAVVEYWHEQDKSETLVRGFLASKYPEASQGKGYRIGVSDIVGWTKTRGRARNLYNDFVQGFCCRYSLYKSLKQIQLTTLTHYSSLTASVNLTLENGT